jgi:putative FmdB family regulatory protein
MPTYVYRREDGTTFEIQQRITEPALEACPTTGQKVKRLITGGAGLIFKGSGFYLTDYARKNGSGSTSKETKTKAETTSNGASGPAPKESKAAKKTSE